MNKAITGTFPNADAANRAINDLRAEGFGGEGVTHLLRDSAASDVRLPGPRLTPGMEPLKGLIAGAIIGAILGAIAYWVLGMTMDWASMGVHRPLVLDIIVLAIAGAAGGLLEGLIAMGPLMSARRTLADRYRGDAVVSVHTDEAHAAKAVTILRNAGASDVRRGAASLPGEFVMREQVTPEPYGTTRREAVAPAPPRADAPAEPFAPSEEPTVPPVGTE